MALAIRWWHGHPSERFWLESTDRDDLGADLRAPLADEAGNDNWRYTLFREAAVGDTVYHYDKRKAAVVARSRVAGPAFESPIVWAARGSYARERRAQPQEVPGYRLPLADFTFLTDPISLETLRTRKLALEAIVNGLPAGARYFPFELSERPVRPLQGYAFKLPAAFVAAFKLSPSEQLGPIADDSEPASTEVDRFRALVAEMEAQAAPFAISGLQGRRTQLRGLKRTASTIFGARRRAADWTFHLGGRNELQFNVGLDNFADGARSFRAGVAFSLEPSRSLPDINVLQPRIARFNAWMREHTEDLAGLAMWYWRGSVRSVDLAPGPIAPALATEGSFIFLGHQQPLEAADPLKALQILDRLLPLWERVQGGDETPSAADADEPLETLRLDSGREIDGGRWISATLTERTLDIYLRHKEIQRRLKAELLAEGFDDVITEPKIGRRSIDLVARRGGALWLYEVKTSADDRGCIREAIGQLLEYALWPGATKPEMLVVVGEPALSVRGAAYLETLNASFPVRVEYRRATLD